MKVHISVVVGGSGLLGGSVLCRAMDSVTVWTSLKGHVSFSDLVTVTGQTKLSRGDMGGISISVRMFLLTVYV